METVNIHAAKTNLSKLIEKVLAGHEIVISRSGKPVAKLAPYSDCKISARKGGQWTGKIKYKGDFADSDSKIASMFCDSSVFPK